MMKKVRREEGKKETSKELEIQTAALDISGR